MFQGTKTKQDKINNLLNYDKNESVKEKRLVNVMERPRHLRYLHYRDERANPRHQHLDNPWAEKR